MEAWPAAQKGHGEKLIPAQMSLKVLRMFRRMPLALLKGTQLERWRE